MQDDSRVFDKLNKANEGLGKISESVGKVQSICFGIVAINMIHDAVKVLSDDQIIYTNPQKAADAFDTLFRGFGRICNVLPPPAKEWAQFFEQFNLFGNMQKNVYAPYFKRFQEIEDQAKR
ncbi:MAG: hypothetical protein IPI97_12715 [Nitrosomonas sp.]|nr:hypothetical protein [Nitrosomonas sp.]MBK7365813.1 hypothetical protein [Nitrosomonas sp.]